VKYHSSLPFDHRQSDKIGILVTNLGTPDAPKPAALRRYLREFLSDTRVVEIPRAVWALILNGIILPLRSSRSAKNYAEVWTSQGSPLLVNTQNQASALQKVFADRPNIELRFAMRYGSPAISQVLDELMQAGVRELIVLPLYPQYSGSTTGSTFDAIARYFMQRRWVPSLHFINEYCDHPGYIRALAQTIRQHRQESGPADRLIFSFHGVPLRYLHQGDPYHCQCLKTARLVAEELGLASEEYLVTFQSRFGRATWLQPYTDVVVKSLPSQGVMSVDVICPGFSADCLETLEEVAVENRDYFLAAGGKTYRYIPALNSLSSHIDCLTELLERQLIACKPFEDDTARRATLANACPFNRV
jgi:protoporphyrin/coproporphyrin ferrochelatase